MNTSTCSAKRSRNEIDSADKARVKKQATATATATATPTVTNKVKTDCLPEDNDDVMLKVLSFCTQQDISNLIHVSCRFNDLVDKKMDLLLDPYFTEGAPLHFHVRESNEVGWSIFKIFFCNTASAARVVNGHLSEASEVDRQSQTLNFTDRSDLITHVLEHCDVDELFGHGEEGEDAKKRRFHKDGRKALMKRTKLCENDFATSARDRKKKCEREGCEFWEIKDVLNDNLIPNKLAYRMIAYEFTREDDARFDPFGYSGLLGSGEILALQRRFSVMMVQ